MTPNDGMSVNDTAAASSTEPIVIVGPLPRRLLSFPASGPAIIPTMYAR